MAQSPSAARALAPLCLASFLWAFSFGVGAPLASLVIERAGFTKKIIGLNTSVYYLGIALAAVLVPWLMRRWGRGCVALGMLASAATVALFPWASSLGGWFGLRFLSGVAGAMSLIPLETLVNHNAPTDCRSRDFGFYAFAVALGMAAGTLVGLQMHPAATEAAFLIGGLAALGGSVVVFAWLPWPAIAPELKHERVPVRFGRNYLSFGSAWSQGFLEGGMVALLPVFLLTFGISEGGVSWLMSGIMVGVITFQVPVAWLADRLGRTTVLLGCYFVTATALGLLPFCTSPVWLAVALFLTGACSGAFYPLGLAVLGEGVPPAGLARASAWYLAINCLGSLTGPALTGLAMDEFGQGAMFLVGEAAVLGVLASWIGLRAVEWLLKSRRSAHADDSARAPEHRAA